MEVFLIVLLVTIIINVIKALTNKEENEIKQTDMKKNEIQVTGEGVQVDIGTRDLLLMVLKRMGCPGTIHDDDSRIFFTYQGENLWAESSNDCLFVNVYDAFWENCERQDTKRIAMLEQAINTVNIRETATVIYTIDEEKDMMWVHCKKNFLFIPQIPDLEQYLKAIFQTLFQAHHVLGAEMERLTNA